jgi:hypothetical protein
MRRFVSLLTLMSCLLIACNGATIPDTPTPRDAAEILLQEVANLVCQSPDFSRRFSTTDTAHRFECSPAEGHSTTATLWWYGNQNEAQAVFEARHEESPVEEFHEFPLSVWDEDFPSFPGGRKEYRVWLWQAHHWLIEVRAFDDTHFLIAPDPETVSEAIYQVGRDQGLFPASDQ